MKALDRARIIGCETVQLFSGNPNSWVKSPLDPDVADKFADKAAELDIHPIILHTPYLLNLASPSDDTWQKSTDALSDAIRRAVILKADYIVTHIGSHKGAGYENGIARICESVKIALDAGDGPVITLELGAGAGNSIGSRFEHLADIFSGLGDAGGRVGICIDTAHLWGSGYAICTPAGVEDMFNSLKSNVGMEKLKVVHLNDTLKELGSHADRHHHIGEGMVGIEGFRAIVNYPGTQNLPGIIETPGEEMGFDKKNLDVLRSLRQTT